MPKSCKNCGHLDLRQLEEYDSECTIGYASSATLLEDVKKWDWHTDDRPGFTEDGLSHWFDWHLRSHVCEHWKEEIGCQRRS